MEIQEALKEIRQRVKPYLDVGMSQSYFSVTIRNIEAGLAKQNTIDDFMAKFGYIRNEIKWQKK